jgi:FMN phosphatase YigB (HAD superfamily)
VDKGVVMIKTILMDYDSTLHDMDTAMEQKLDGTLGLSGKELYKIWVYDIHRGKIHRKYLDQHDDIMFHCELLFDYLDKPFNDETAKNICNLFEQAKKQAKFEPIYYPETIETLDKLKEREYLLCQVLVMMPKRKQRLWKGSQEKNIFHIFSASQYWGY